MYSKNLTLMTDFYQLTMMQGYFLSNRHNKLAVFDLFFRTPPFGNSFAICAGLEQAIDYVSNITFTDDDIDYLRSNGTFVEEFLDYLKTFKFSGDIYAIKEGTVVFPNEPLVRVKSTIIECQFIETALLNIINHQSLIATKAQRVVHAVGDDKVLEFGLRRAQGPDAGIFGARATIIGGCDGTSNVLAGKLFDVPISGTHAHSWIMSFDSELEAFRVYANTYKENCYLLVDTYNTLKSGVPNAIKIFQEQKEKGILPKQYGIRLDSGDLAYLSIESRLMLDNAGFADAIISASSDLDEYLIRDLKLQGAKITLWGVGTNMITAKDCPSFGGVYKISAEFDDDKLMPKIKLSDNPAKITNPGVKKIIRLIDKKTNKIKADLITLEHETVDSTKDLIIFDPLNIWKQMLLTKNEFITEELLIPIILNGKIVYEFPHVMDIKKFCKYQLSLLWNTHKRLTNPQFMPVDLSKELYDLKEKMHKDLINM